MNESQNHTPQAYQTGPTTPPKSYGGVIAFLLCCVISISGIASFLSFMNIPVFELIETQSDQGISSLSRCKTQPTEQVASYALYPDSYGISGQDLSQVCRNYYRIPHGIYITQVQTGTDFYAKGLRSGDIVLDLNDTPVADWQTLEAFLNSVEEDQPVKLSFYRHGKRYQVVVQLTAPEGAE